MKKTPLKITSNKAYLEEYITLTPEPYLYSDIWVLITGTTALVLSDLLE